MEGTHPIFWNSISDTYFDTLPAYLRTLATAPQHRNPTNNLLLKLDRLRWDLVRRTDGMYQG